MHQCEGCSCCDIFDGTGTSASTVIIACRENLPEYHGVRRSLLAYLRHTGLEADVLASFDLGNPLCQLLRLFVVEEHQIWCFPFRCELRRVHSHEQSAALAPPEERKT